MLSCLLLGNLSMIIKAASPNLQAERYKYIPGKTGCIYMCN